MRAAAIDAGSLDSEPGKAALCPGRSRKLGVCGCFLCGVNCVMRVR